MICMGKKAFVMEVRVAVGTNEGTFTSSNTKC